MFLMVAAVKRTCRALTVEQRLGECMADAAVSILITALTGFLLVLDHPHRFLSDIPVIPLLWLCHPDTLAENGR